MASKSVDITDVLMAEVNLAAKKLKISPKKVLELYVGIGAAVDKSLSEDRSRFLLWAKTATKKYGFTKMKFLEEKDEQK